MGFEQGTHFMAGESNIERMQSFRGTRAERQFMSISGLPMTKAASYDIVRSRGADYHTVPLGPWTSPGEPGSRRRHNADPCLETDQIQDPRTHP
jgi:hypothetical protein